MKSNFTRRDFLQVGRSGRCRQRLAADSQYKVVCRSGVTDFGSVRFAVISDPHVDIKGKNGMKMSQFSLDCVTKTVAALNMDKELKFVMVCGDLLLDGEWENAKAIKAELDRLKAPYMVVAGNHDFKPADPKKLREGYTYLSIEEFVEFFSGHGYEEIRQALLS